MRMPRRNHSNAICSRLTSLVTGHRFGSTLPQQEGSPRSRLEQHCLLGLEGTVAKPPTRFPWSHRAESRSTRTGNGHPLRHAGRCGPAPGRGPWAPSRHGAPFAKPEPAGINSQFWTQCLSGPAPPAALPAVRPIRCFAVLVPAPTGTCAVALARPNKGIPL